MAQPIVFVHGWGMNAKAWQPMVDSCPAAFEPLLLELPGHGQARQQIFPHQLDELVEGLLEQAPASAVWCGWSLGALAGLGAALRHADRMQGLVLIAGTPRFMQSADWPAGTPVALFREFAQRMADDSSAGWRRFMLLCLQGDPLARQRAREFTACVQAGGMPSSQALQAGLAVLENTDLRSELKRIQQPVRLICGGQDTVCSAQASHWLQRQCGWPLLEIEAGHAPHWARPDQVWKAIDEVCHASCTA